MNLRPSRPALACFGYVVAHIVAHLSAAHFEAAPGISTWYPPAGLALGFLLLMGRRWAPLVFLTQSLTAFVVSGFHEWWAPLAFPAIITLAYTLGAAATRRWSGGPSFPETRRAITVHVAAMVLSPILVALLGSGLLLQLGLTTEAEFWRGTLLWWVGDVSGMITVVPFLLVFAGPWLHGARYSPALAQYPRTADAHNSQEGEPNRRGMPMVRFTIQSAALLGSLSLVFAFEPLRQYNAFYLTFLPLIWICFSHGLRGATLATLAVTMCGLLELHWLGSTHDLIVNFLLFEFATAAVGLGLGAVVVRRRLAEQSLAASEQRLDRVIKGSRLGLWDWDLSTDIITHNRQSLDLVGWHPTTLENPASAWLDQIHPDDRDVVKQQLRDHLEGRSPFYEAVYRIRGDQQRWRWLLARGSVVLRGPDGRPLRMSGTHKDVTERKRAEAESSRLLQVVEATTDFVATITLDGSIAYANTSMGALAPEATTRAIVGRKIADFLPDWAMEILTAEALPDARRLGTWHGDIALRGRDGAEIPVSLVMHHQPQSTDDQPAYTLVLRSLERQKQAEAGRIENERRMMQSQKMESLGVLAGGVAHDFNNLLTPMLGYASLAKLDIPEDSPAQSALTHIETAANRAATLCQQMLAFAGRSPLAFTELNLSELISQTRQLLQVSVGKKHLLELELATDLPQVVGDPAQLRQLVMNLVLNAAEAVSRREPGRVRIRTRLERLEHQLPPAGFHGPLPSPGEYVLLEVDDNGVGLSPELLHRIFEPFFTTKHSGHGLGLPVVLGILKTHSGAIHLTSEPDKGTTVRVYLPTVPWTTHEDEERPTALGLLRSTGLVLVVDDEPGVREVVAHTIRSLGFETVAAQDGVEALEKFKQHHRELRFVILDLSMPRMDGEQAFKEMHRHDPAVPVILMSGYSDKLSLDRFSETKPAAFLAKPFNYSVLKERLQAL